MAIEVVRVGVQSGDAAKEANGTLVWQNLQPIISRLGLWILERCNDFGTEMAKAAGKSLGEKLPYLLIATPVGALIWREWHTIFALLSNLVK